MSTTPAIPRRQHRFLPLALVALILCAGSPATTAADTSAGSPRIQRVALFKNGLAFITGQVDLPAKARFVGLGDLPAPVHGTMWLEYDPSVPVLGIASRHETTTELQSVQSIAELLSANVGRSVTLMPGSIHGELQSAGETLALLRTEDGTLAIHPNRLEGVVVHGDRVASSLTKDTEHRHLRLELSRPAPGATVGFSYLTRGLTWAPSYRMSLDDDHQARLVGKAVLVNEVLELDDVDADLVTGFPHLLFNRVTSPLDSQQTLDAYLSALRQRQQPATGNQRILRQSVSNALTSVTQLGDAAVGEEISSEHLFFYPVPGVSLRPGERLAVQFLDASVPYEHIYTWEIPDYFDLDQRTFGNDPLDDEEEVWHVFRFKNTTPMPLTTAPAQFVKAGQIVGQDMLHYTPIGATTSVRINRALAISAEQAETEVDRQALKERLHGNYYDRISLRGELKLINGLGTSAQVEVTKSLSGDLGDVSGSPQQTQAARGLREINPSHQLKWTVDLAPGSTQILAYEYSMLVRR